MDKNIYFKSNLTPLKIAIFALLGAMLFVVQIALKVVPNVELVSFLILIYTLKFKYQALIPVYVFVLLEGLIYGFGSWWIGYLYIWAIFVFVVIGLMKLNLRFNPLSVAIILGLYGLSFGFLFAIEYAFIGGFKAGLSYFISGFSYDLLHAAANFVIGLILTNPILKIFKKVNL